MRVTNELSIGERASERGEREREREEPRARSDPSLPMERVAFHRTERADGGAMSGELLRLQITKRVREPSFLRAIC